MNKNKAEIERMNRKSLDDVKNLINQITRQHIKVFAIFTSPNSPIPTTRFNVELARLDIIMQQLLVIKNTLVSIEDDYTSEKMGRK